MLCAGDAADFELWGFGDEARESRSGIFTFALGTAAGDFAAGPLGASFADWLSVPAPYGDSLQLSTGPMSLVFGIMLVGEGSGGPLT